MSLSFKIYFFLLVLGAVILVESAVDLFTGVGAAIHGLPLISRAISEVASNLAGCAYTLTIIYLWRKR